jgi:transposase
VIPHGAEIFLGLEPIDLRWGFDRLAGIVEARVARKPRSGALFVFFGKRREAIKILFHDGSGFCLFYKRLDAGTFRLPEALEPSATTVTLDDGALEDLLDGIDAISAPARKRASGTH